MTTVLAFMGLFVVVITIHECGHLWMARRYHVPIKSFQIGYGPILYQRFIHNTAVSWRLFPIGGSVHFVRQDFDALPSYQKGLIYLAGPMASILLAVLLLWGAALSPQPRAAVIAMGQSIQSPFEKGDTIIKINQTLTPHDEAFKQALNQTRDIQQPLDITLRKPSGDLKQINLSWDQLHQNSQSWLTQAPKAWVVKGFHWQSAVSTQIQVGDRLMSINGVPMSGTALRAALTQWRVDDSLLIDIHRAGEKIQVAITPGLLKGQAYLGMILEEQSPQATILDYPGVIQAGKIAWSQITTVVTHMILPWWHWLSGEGQAPHLSGPISLSYYATLTWQYAFSWYIQLMGILSLSLGFLNLLPLPCLDGGQCLKVCLSPRHQQRWSAALQPLSIGLLCALGLWIAWQDFQITGLG